MIAPLAALAKSHGNQLARIHAIWGLGQIGRQDTKALEPLLPLAADADPEIRAEIARVLGDARFEAGFTTLIGLMKDASPRVRHLAAIAAGRLGRKEAAPAAIALLRENDDKDAILRHSAVMALVGSHDLPAILAAAKDPAVAVRMGSLLALRRLEDPRVAQFLHDSDPLVVLEAARAINDLPLPAAMPQLAKLSDEPLIGDGPTRDALLRRVLNANFRLGMAENAAAVARFAARGDAPESLRIEALRMLGDWAKPSPHDRVTNFYWPLPPRAAGIAAKAIVPALGSVLAGSDALRRVGAEIAGRLGIKEVAPALADLAADAKRPTEVRVEALRALQQLNDRRVDAAVALALKDAAPAVRNAGRSILAERNPAKAIGPLAAALDHGTTLERQGALAALAKIKRPQADRLLSQWMDKLLAGHVPPELQLDLLTAAQRGTPELKEKLARFNLRGRRRRRSTPIAKRSSAVMPSAGGISFSSAPT